MTTNWALYDKLLVEKEQETEIILVEAAKHHKQDPTNIEAEKHYRQALANHETAKREREAWNQRIEERLKGMEQFGQTKDTAQSNYEQGHVIS